ncbi:MAG TPA: ATP-binding cassette domain-containing protein [Archangium sp.]|uniref:peptidase domain-containing ABC transporter n=1 Tax=Archangium sp. TaxID=1872627 RepID=UPI002E32F7E9|nr:ATP-binding cassette domain-containing protein [Archangium sp.]HEX5747948.1 ATP-binding cassette domain-containing protein [Archangium sp.]
MAHAADAPTPWQRLRAVMAPERGDLWVVLLYGIAVGVLSLVVPIAAQSLVNTAAFGTLLQPVVVLALVVFGMLVLAGGLRGIQVAVTERLQQRLFARMAIDVAWRLARTRQEAWDAHRGTELVNRFLDVMTIQKATALILLDGFALVLQSVIGMVLLALYSPFLLGFDVLLLAGMAFVILGLGRGAVRTSVEESYRKYEVVAWLEELARVPMAFTGPHGAALALRRADDVTVAYLEARQGHFRVLLRQVLGSLALQALASSLLLGLGGWLVVRQQLTLGQLVAAELVVTPVVSSFAKIGKYLESLYDLLAAVDKVGHLFDLPLEREGGEPLPGKQTPEEAHPASLRLQDVTLAATGAERPVLKGVTLEVAPGSRVAVMGRHGAGKSQLTSLALGLRTPTQGAVELDGVDLREVRLEDMRSQVALVRGIALFDGTLLDNVRMGREELSLHQVREALAAVRLLEEVAVLPEGLQTWLSGGHLPLSTGQVQRLMLARALVGRPRLLVLDEALDSLEASVRTQVLDTVLAPGAPWTVLLTTHIPELAARCDRVLRLEDGRLEEVRP